MTLTEVKKSILDKRLILTKTLHEVAEAFNGEWSPAWGEGTPPKYYISGVPGELTVHRRRRFAPAGTIFFMNEEDAQEALDCWRDEFEFITGDLISKAVFIDKEWYISLTDLDVDLVAEGLINTNGPTTTLEIKKRLREFGFFATQRMVSEAMQRLLYPFTDNGQYRSYYL